LSGDDIDNEAYNVASNKKMLKLFTVINNYNSPNRIYSGSVFRGLINSLTPYIAFYFATATVGLIQIKCLVSFE